MDNENAHLHPAQTFDIVVVGAGPGGCATAARIADARPHWKVALIETGPARGNFMVSTPAALSGLVGGANRHNYGYQTVPQPGLAGRSSFQPRGRGVGGSSLINAMVYIRGQAQDYDGWAAAGCHGWGWNDVLPLFRRSEDNRRGEDAFHGVGGPLHVDDLWCDTPVTRAFVDAAIEAGHVHNPDFNGATQEGVGLYQVFQKNGRRFDAGSAYIHARERSNLTVLADTKALRLEFDERRVTGVVVRDRHGERSIRAVRETVLAGGAFCTPQLLMLSGIGPAGHLRDHGIRVVADRAQVGENLQDHLDHVSNRFMHGSGVLGTSLRGATPIIKGLLPFLRGGRGALSSNLAEAGGFLRSSPELDRPDLQLHFVIGLAGGNMAHPTLKTGVSLHVCLLRPGSRGTVRLLDGSADSAPLIDPRYLDDPEDLAGMVRGVRIAEHILAQPAFDRLDERFSFQPSADEAAIVDSIRNYSETIYHPVGTCRMGSDEASVVDPELRVRGVTGLRIADASIMPTLVSGNTQAPTAMIGERAADLILKSKHD